MVRDKVPNIIDGYHYEQCAHAWSDWWCRVYGVRDFRICRRCGGTEERDFVAQTFVMSPRPITLRERAVLSDWMGGV